jgi:hypothetical protein
MPGIEITAAEAALLVGNWANLAIRPLCIPSDQAPDFSQDAACDVLLKQLGKNPWRPLPDVPQAILLLVWTRVVFFCAVGETTPGSVVARLSAKASSPTLLRFLISHNLARTKLPDTWRRAMMPDAYTQLASMSSPSARTH